MKISKRVECKNEIKRISDIYFKAQEALLIVKVFYDENEKSDEYLYEKNRNSFFYYSRIIYWQISVMELSKLFVSRERFSIIRFLDKLKQEGYFSSLKINIKKINDWEKRIVSNYSAIENLKDLRDKVYAHDDMNNHTIKNDVSIKKALELLDIGKDVITEIYEVVMNETLAFDVTNTPSYNLHCILNRLVEEQKTAQEEHINYIQNIHNPNNN